MTAIKKLKIGLKEIDLNSPFVGILTAEEADRIFNEVLEELEYEKI